MNNQDDPNTIETSFPVKKMSLDSSYKINVVKYENDNEFQKYDERSNSGYNNFGASNGFENNFSVGTTEQKLPKVSLDTPETIEDKVSVDLR